MSTKRGLAGFLAAVISAITLGAVTLNAKAVSAFEPEVAYFADSARVIARWAAPSGSGGAPDSYTVTWAAGAAPVVRSTTKLADTAWFPRPVYPATTNGTVSVVAVRRGKASLARTASFVITGIDSAPAPVDSLKVDTLALGARTDSVVTTAYVGGIASRNPTVAEGDTIRFIARVYMKSGFTRRPTDTIAWSTAAVAAMAMPTYAAQPRGDTLLLVALNCNCEESGYAVLDLSSGRYLTRTASGGFRPVTPRSANPYARSQ